MSLAVGPASLTVGQWKEWEVRPSFQALGIQSSLLELII